MKLSKIVQQRIEAAKPVMQQMAAAGYMAPDIAAKIGVTDCTAHKYLRAAGIQYNRKHRPVYCHDKTGWEKRLLPLYHRGVKREDLAKLVGCSGPTISRWLADAGLTRNPRNTTR